MQRLVKIFLRGLGAEWRTGAGRLNLIGLIVIAGGVLLVSYTHAFQDIVKDIKPRYAVSVSPLEMLIALAGYLLVCIMMLGFLTPSRK